MKKRFFGYLLAAVAIVMLFSSVALAEEEGIITSLVNFNDLPEELQAQVKTEQNFAFAIFHESLTETEGSYVAYIAYRHIGHVAYIKATCKNKITNSSSLRLEVERILFLEAILYSHPDNWEIIK
ncbi:MAG: hypothetical protein U9R14_02395 [Patescibacteria group bacterium]|nr:hypothetical protein [Patescibacteria group bacterium]